jgi:hypothetical protein
LVASTASGCTAFDHIVIEHLFATVFEGVFRDLALLLAFRRSSSPSAGSVATVSDEFPKIEAEQHTDFRKWLEENHAAVPRRGP